jgi:uncharacterized protein (DUF58 family)
MIAALRRWLDVIPPTPRGVGVGLLSALALFGFGIRQIDLVLLVIGVAGTALAWLCAALVAIAAWKLAREVRRDPARAPLLAWTETRRRVETGFSLPAFAHWPLIELDCAWIDPPGFALELRENDDGRLAEHVFAQLRCESTRLRRRFEVGDALGLARVRFELECDARLQVLPDRGHLTQSPRVTAFADADVLPHPHGAPEGDRMEIRRYAPGDSARDVLWKHYARSGALHVRRPERAVDRSQRLVGYLVTGPGDEPAAAAARVALETGALGPGWVFGTDGDDRPERELGAALRLIARSGGRSGEGSGLARFLARVATDAQVHCVVFAPARSGAWLQHLEAAAWGRRDRLAVVLASDGAPRAARALPALARWLLAREGESGPALSDFEDLLAQLRAQGHPVTWVDRASGRMRGGADRLAGAA